MTHKNILETKKQIEAMDQVREAATSVYFPSSKTRAFAFSDEYIRWQTNRVSLMSYVINNVMTYLNVGQQT